LVLLFEGKERTVTRLLIDPESKEEVEREITQKDFIVFGKYYLPEETIQLAGNDHYIKWVKEGYITETPGARTDFLYIENDLKGINIDHPIIELAFDPREASYLINNVSEWLGSHTVDGDEVSRCVEITQGPMLMSEPMKETEGRIYSQTLWHTGDPVFTWQMGNVVKKQGRNSGPVKYYYPTKEKAEFKIDVCVALIMAVSRAMKAVETGSVYDGLSKEDMRKKLRGEL
jgi:phage terminase large subunit-like protein